MTAEPEHDEDMPGLPPGLLAVFAQARRLADQHIAENAGLDTAWRSGDALEAIRRLQRQARADVDRLTGQALDDQEDLISD